MLIVGYLNPESATPVFEAEGVDADCVGEVLAAAVSTHRDLKCWTISEEREAADDTEPDDDDDDDEILEG